MGRILGVLVYSAALLFLIILLLPNAALALEKLTRSDFAEPVITGITKKYYIGGESLEIKYTIKPASDELASKIDGEGNVYRYYHIYTILQQSSISATVVYKTGFTRKAPMLGTDTYEAYDSGKHLIIAISGAMEGLAAIDLEITGIMPSTVKRFEKTKIVWFNISDSEENALPPVEVNLVNPDKFLSDISYFRGKISEYENKLTECKNMGIDVSEAESLFNKIKNNLTAGDNYYKQGEYESADEKLKAVEKELENLEIEIIQAKVNYYQEESKDKLEGNITTSLNNAAIILDELKKKEALNLTQLLDYTSRVDKLQREKNKLLEDLDKVKEYIEEKNYQTALSKAKEVYDSTVALESEAFKLESELSNLATKLTPTPTKTPTGGGVTLPALDLKLVGIICGVLIAGAILAIIIKRRRGRGGWDELR